jgi:hypothetical protein
MLRPMYEHWIRVQDAGAGILEETSADLGRIANSFKFKEVASAVAYANPAGTKALVGAVGGAPSWATSNKRWLISIDFGITEPLALEILSKLPKSEVRIPDGLEVLERKLWPRRTFHPKCYVFGSLMGSSSNFGCLIGSANLTGGGLAHGTEISVGQIWRGTLTGQTKKSLAEARDTLGWFETAWDRADPLSTVLSDYKKLKPIIKTRTLEDQTEAGGLYEPPTPAEVDGDLAVQLANAKALWVEVDTLYKNLGPARPGNQLDLPRGTRVFFGFPSPAVSLNTILGYIELQAEGHSAFRKSVRFGNNSMDKVNLPVPHTEGPATYDHKILLFERQPSSATGVSRFTVRLGNKTDLKKWKAAATTSSDLTMSSGRSYGLLF